MQRFFSLVAFAHTVFALPFALLMVLVASREWTVTWQQFFWIILALISARTCAMAWNRIVDAKIDKVNPRTATREIPSGKITIKSALNLFFLSLCTFLGAAAFLGSHCLVAAPLVILILCGYSFVKRFSAASHLVLGLALACAPGGAWYALTAQLSSLPLWLMGGILLWVAGFDILYAIQDIEFDRRSNLFSIPARLGTDKSIVVAFLFHVCAWSLFYAFGSFAAFKDAYFIGLYVFGVFLLLQHLRIKTQGARVINSTFFAFNGCASILLLLFSLFDSSLT